MSQSLENNVGFQVVENLIITKVRVLWKIKNWLLFLDLIILIVEDFHKALSDEIHFFYVTLVANYTLAWSIDSAVHTDDQLIGKASLALLKEMIE
jgi:hypothetical protein